MRQRLRTGSGRVPKAYKGRWEFRVDGRPGSRPERRGDGRSPGGYICAKRVTKEKRGSRVCYAGHAAIAAIGRNKNLLLCTRRIKGVKDLRKNKDGQWASKRASDASKNRARSNRHVIIRS